MLNLDQIKEIENSVMHLCSTYKTLSELQIHAEPLWLWTAHTLNISPDKLLTEIASHSTDEQFSDPYLEYKDHLLKLPVLLLEKYHRSH